MKNLRLLAVILLLSSCQDFLELQPQSEANAENFYRTTNDFNSALIAAYAKLQDYPDIYTEMVGYRSDELFLSAPTSGAQDRYDNDRFRTTSSNTLIINAWSSYYNGISRCNEIISRIPGAPIHASFKSQYEAEARFIRALHYFHLVRFWGNVPLILQPIRASDALQIGRSAQNEVYQAIEDDLLWATQHLPASYSGSDLGRATAGAAWTLLGKVYLTEKKYPEATTALEKVLNGPYQLLDSLASVFDASNKMNAEVVFAIRYNKEVIGEGHGRWQSTTDVTNSPISPALLNAYSVDDQRKTLLQYTRDGSVYVLNKYFDVLSTINNTVGNDFIVLRYADVLLMQAEAINETGYSANGPAFTYLNAVRQRAGLSPVTAVELPDQLSFRREVLNERKREFALEGHRWFDLIRTGGAQEAMQAGQGIAITPEQYLYPIPQPEIEKISNPTIFPQNPGY